MTSSAENLREYIRGPLTGTQAAALDQASYILDCLDRLEDAIWTQGHILPDGGPNPLLKEARSQRLVLVRLLALVGLNAAESVSDKATRAASARWRR